MEQPKLTIEAVPSTTWYENLRHTIPAKQWDTIRKLIYKKANYRCEICGGKGERHPVEAHELWTYDDENHVQTLVGLIALCPPCHRVKHIVRTIGIGNHQEAIEHLMVVNDWAEIEIAEKYVAESLRLFDRRSTYKWTVNMDWLENFLVINNIAQERLF